jgi:hypothetical protein
MGHVETFACIHSFRYPWIADEPQDARPAAEVLDQHRRRTGIFRAVPD